MLTDHEKIILHYYVLTDRDDWQNYFIMSHPDKNLSNLSKASLKTYVSNWRNNPEVKDYILNLQIEKRKANQDTSKINIDDLKPVESESRNKETINANSVNFLDRDEFLKFLNDRANEVQDDKLRNDILKMLSDNQRYKDIDKAENQEINKFYTPLTCPDCPLYQEKQKTL